MFNGHFEFVFMVLALSKAYSVHLLMWTDTGNLLLAWPELLIQVFSFA